MADLIFQLQAGTGKRTEQIRQRMLQPLPEALCLELGRICQRGGEGSFEEQFAHEAEMNRSVSVRWKRTQDFGSRKAPSKTLHDKGDYERAFTGRGPGSVLKAVPNGVQVGVDRTRFPQVTVFQRSGITIRPVSAKQRFYLGMTYGVWLKKSTRTLKTEGRPVSMNRGITGRARKPVARYFSTGQITATALGAAA